LKAPGTKRLKLNLDILLSSSAFNFSLRRYTMAAVGGALVVGSVMVVSSLVGGANTPVGGVNFIEI
jgi:hypothetical protein